jgi:hypothetical protein
MPRHLIQPTIWNEQYGITGESADIYFKMGYNVNSNEFGCGTYLDKGSDLWIQYIEKI